MSPAQFAAKLHEIASQFGEPSFVVLSNDTFAECVLSLDLKNSAAVMEAECSTLIIPDSNQDNARRRAEILARLLEMCFNAPSLMNDALLQPDHPGFVLDQDSAVHYRQPPSPIIDPRAAAKRKWE